MRGQLESSVSTSQSLQRLLSVPSEPVSGTYSFLMQLNRKSFPLCPPLRASDGFREAPAAASLSLSVQSFAEGLGKAERAASAAMEEPSQGLGLLIALIPD